MTRRAFPEAGSMAGVRSRRGMALLSSVALVAGLCMPTGAVPQGEPVNVNTYGVPGLIDMPTAFAQPDGELTAHLAYFGGTSRGTLGFQIAPRIQGTFRYSGIGDFDVTPDGQLETLYDRSFDIRFQVLKEGRVRPAVTVGLQDFGGTGIYSGEYVVASKRFFDGRLAVTGGIGWGRFGTRNAFDNPLGELSDRFDTRPTTVLGTGGQVSTDQFFRGPAALFAGMSWRATDRLTVSAEYSSDSYVRETARGAIEDDSPVNLGFSYRVRPGVDVQGFTVLGSEVGLGLTFALNPKEPPNGASGFGPAPVPVEGRPAPAAAPGAWSTDWAGDPRTLPVLEGNLVVALGEAGLKLESFALEATSAQVRFRNPTFREQAQAVGRAARALTYALPASVETFALIPVGPTGLAGQAVVLRRSDLEALENEPERAWRAYARARIVDSEALPDVDFTRAEEVRPDFTWQIGPYATVAYFDPDSPIDLNVGVQASARYEPVSGLVLSGTVRQQLASNRDGDLRFSESALPRVRSDANIYAAVEDAYVPELTAAYFFRPAANLYGRVTAGLLETQFGGVSAELLWHPDNSRFSLGAEVARVRQRGFDQLFEFREYEVTTGHVSAYYAHDNGFHSQLDVGRYLAGDVGATYTLTREFDNGWKIGAYATKTDVTSEEFGEGSFDKGIRIEVPLDWVLGRPTRREAGLTIQPILRDGGARLNVEDRLYDLTRDLVQPDLGEGWERFWR